MDIQQLAKKAEALGFNMEAYTRGMSLLLQSRVFELLRENGRIFPVSPDAPNYLEYQASIANWSIGYNTALDHLLGFRDLLDAAIPEQKPLADFGAMDKTVKEGNLTKEEADAIRAEFAITNTIK